jgi:protoporphyrinogen oxidase
MLEEHGGCVELQSSVVALRHNNGRIIEVIARRKGREQSFQGTDVITSMPRSELIPILDPPVPQPVLRAADGLTYRDFLSVILIVNKPNLFPDNWIYIHEPDVRVGRVQNFKNWSPQMVPDPRTSSLGLEYFCNVGDASWSMPDAELIELGKSSWLGQLENVSLGHGGSAPNGDRKNGRSEISQWVDCHRTRGGRT